MPESTPREYDQEELDRLLTEMHALIPGAVRQACHKLGHHLGDEEFEGRQQDLYVTLRDKDYRVLRSFRGDSEPSAWLFKIAERQIKRWLEKVRRKISIDDAPPDSLTTEANQEKDLIREEEVVLLGREINQLNPEERKVVRMVADGRTTKEIAQVLGKSEGAARVQRSRVIAKLRKATTSSREKRWPK